MNISPQSKIVLLLAFYLVIGFVLGIIIVETQSLVFVVIFFVWFIVANILLNKVKCPKCQEPIVGQNSVKSESFLGRIFKERCSNCGHDLTRKIK